MTTATPSSTPPQGPRPARTLHAETVGNGPRLVLAHGFTQTGRVWGSMDGNLAADHHVVRVDLPGHGGSAAVAAGLEDGALLLGGAGGRAIYLGYSMGARFCLHLALARPDLVAALVLISGTAGIEDEAERRRRRASDDELAEELDPIRGPGPPLAVGTFVRRWLDGPMFAGISPSANGLDERLRNTGPGLASSLRLAGTGTQRPLWDSIGRLTMPVLIISGELDEKFTALGARMAEAIGATADRAVVRGAGHAPHLQRPDEVATLVRVHGHRAGGC
ncbi:MAG: alpha/beta fold hydrolase [Acidimicrobiales bacterium]|jgi:2-succinyl-6-hydroxy-2,4-cyclohexadiene-1-carboxylate synthase